MILEMLKTVLYGLVEGITEWLPISSTGHLILLENFIHLKVDNPGAFMEMFNVVIQLGAILAVIVLFFRKLNPFAPSKSVAEKKGTWDLWFKVVVGVLPSAIIGFLLDDWMDAHLYNYVVVAIMLILYGIAFLFVEQLNKRRAVKIKDISEISYRTAIFIGLFQCLALIPGTSRSGATILGAILLGVSRSAGAEFSFFLAIPTMVGASGLKFLDFLTESTLGSTEIVLLATGCLVSFLVSLLVIKSLMEYVRKHSFAAFGYYRIILGAVVLLYFLLK